VNSCFPGTSSPGLLSRLLLSRMGQLQVGCWLDAMSLSLLFTCVHFLLICERYVLERAVSCDSFIKPLMLNCCSYQLFCDCVLVTNISKLSSVLSLQKV